MPQALDQRGRVVPNAFRMKPGFGQSVAYTGTAGTIATEFSTIKATATLTSDNTTPSDGDTVVVGGVTYTFKTALTPTAGQVLINGSADAALLNLIRAINHSGTAGTDYANSGVTAVANPIVSAATSVTAHAFLVTALIGGTASMAYPLASSNAHTTWSSSFLSGGSDDARNTRFVRALCTTAAFVRIGVSPTAVAGDYPMTANVAETFPVFPGEKISAVQVASGGTLYCMELD